MLIHAYRVQLGCLLQLTYFDEGQPWTTFHQMRQRKQTNKQTIKKTNMTQPAELDWGCHATTIAWRRRLWDSYSSSVIKYPTFSLGYFHSSLFFFIFKHVRSTIVWILFLAMAESNLPTTGKELEVKNEFPATGEKTQQGKT